MGSVHPINSRIVSRDRLLPGIHGLRGIAALAVVLFHLIYVGDVRPPDWLAFLTRDFHYSVHLFFVLSAYSMMHSTQRTMENEYWVRNYFIKRFFRIAPLFYVLLSFELSRQAFSGSVATSMNHILLNFTFSFGAVPDSGIVWGGWSVGVEMMFYAIFPVLLISARSLRAAAGLTLAGIVTSYLTRSALHQQYLASTPQPQLDWSYFSFMPNLAFFCMGIFAFMLARHIKEGNGRQLGAVRLSSVVLITALLLTGREFLWPFGGAIILAYGIAFAGITLWQGITPSPWAGNHVLAFLGERSYSIYLSHPVVIHFYKSYFPGIHQWMSSLPGAFFISLAVILLIVLSIAELTYRFIEVPGIAAGQRLIRRLT